MKTTINLKLAIAALLVTGLGYGQELDKEVLHQLNNTSLSQSQAQIEQNQNSSIFITQVGVANTIETSVDSPQATIDFTQNGSNNRIKMIDRADQINLSVIQNGSQNSINKYNFFNSTIVNSTFVQNGSNQDINVFGENSISEAMKITMNGDSQSIIVRNFN